MIHALVAPHIPALQAACREFGVERLEVFGSAATDDFDPERSDVDFLVSYPEPYDFGDFGAKLFALEDRLTTILGRTAHLVMTSALEKPRFHQQAAPTRTPIFAAAD